MSGTRIQWNFGKRGRGDSGGHNKRQKISTNAAQIPPVSGLRGYAPFFFIIIRINCLFVKQFCSPPFRNKLLVISMISRQVLARVRFYSRYDEL